MKEQCDRCGKLDELTHHLERTWSYPSWRYDLCWYCGEWLRDKLKEKEAK